MAKTAEYQHPLSWSSPDFSLDSYNLVFLPGGHEKGVRQIIDSPIIHKQLGQYFPATKKPSKKTVAAICHGVMVLSETQNSEGKSIIHECDTTALPGRFEQVAFWGTRAFLGDYYKTYGVGSDNVEDSVSVRPLLEAVLIGNSRCGNDWTILRSSTKTASYRVREYSWSVDTPFEINKPRFVVQDEKYNYLSGRFPNDAQLLAEQTIALVKSTML